jgi:hypothetical protein
MTVLSEHISLRRYDYLEFVEWLDMICRCAITHYKEKETITFKVELMLKIIYKKRYDSGLWNPEDNVLHPVINENK